MSMLKDHIAEFVGTFDPDDEAAADSFREAVSAHFTSPQAGATESGEGEPLRRSVVTVEVLWNAEHYSKHPDWDDLMVVAAEGFDGSASIQTDVTVQEEVSRSQMITLMEEQGSDPEFLLGSLCRFPDCAADPDDGEGWDGWCGHHADTIEAHRDPEHGHVPSERTDCAVCSEHADPPRD